MNLVGHSIDSGGEDCGPLLSLPFGRLIGLTVTVIVHSIPSFVIPPICVVIGSVDDKQELRSSSLASKRRSTAGAPNIDKSFWVRRHLRPADSKPRANIVDLHLVANGNVTEP